MRIAGSGIQKRRPAVVVSKIDIMVSSSGSVSFEGVKDPLKGRHILPHRDYLVHDEF